VWPDATTDRVLCQTYASSYHWHNVAQTSSRPELSPQADLDRDNEAAGTARMLERDLKLRSWSATTTTIKGGGGVSGRPPESIVADYGDCGGTPTTSTLDVGKQASTLITLVRVPTTFRPRLMPTAVGAAMQRTARASRPGQVSRQRRQARPRGGVLSPARLAFAPLHKRCGPLPTGPAPWGDWPGTAHFPRLMQPVCDPKYTKVYNGFRSYRFGQ